MLTIEDLGILRDVEDDRRRGRPSRSPRRTPAARRWTRSATTSSPPSPPTGDDDVRVEFVLAPAWTTDWMSDEGRRKLLEYGIVPPRPRGSGPVALTLSLRCPQCGSPDTRELSRFGSTACKSLWVCGSLPGALRPLQGDLSEHLPRGLPPADGRVRRAGHRRLGRDHLRGPRGAAPTTTTSPTASTSPCAPSSPATTCAATTRSARRPAPACSGSRSSGCPAGRSPGTRSTCSGPATCST